MRVIDVIQGLQRVPPTHMNLPLVVRGTDDNGNVIIVEVTGAISMDTTEHGPRVVLR